MSGSSTSLSNQQKQPDPGTSSAHVPVGKINDRVDQLALVQSTLQNGATWSYVFRWHFHDISADADSRRTFRCDPNYFE